MSTDQPLPSTGDEKLTPGPTSSPSTLETDTPSTAETDTSPAPPDASTPRVETCIR